MKPTRFLVPLFALLLAAAPMAASADSSAPWHVYNLTASGRTLNSPAAVGVNGDAATFDFLGTPTTSYLLNHQLGGDITGKTITATFSIDGSGTLFYDPTGNIPGTPFVRIFFETSGAGGFNEANFWWSHAGSENIAVNGTELTITAHVGDAGDWSDFFGHFGDDANFAPGFAAAAANATYVGLSFGGGFFFANGVGVDGTATFHLDTFTVN